MKPMIWATVAFMTMTPVYGQSPGTVVVVRESGRPEQRCLVESREGASSPFLVRDVATGERLHVMLVEGRRSCGPPLVRVVARLDPSGDNGMTQALAASPAAAGPRRAPTNAELAGPSARGAARPVGGFKPVTSLPTRPTRSPVRHMLDELHFAREPAQRERAAATLVLSEARTMPEVVKALMRTAREDADPRVRVCAVRGLYRLAADVPDVLPVLVALADDANTEVAQTARLALQELERR